MKTYSIREPIVLSLLTYNDQFDVTLDTKDNYLLEADDQNIFIVKGGKTYETNTTPSMIEIWLEKEKIQLV